MSPASTAQEAIQNARQAMQRGDRRAARRWAEQAASVAPELEEPWLVLATIASPRASVEYMRRALATNPHSDWARKGLERALQRLRQETPSQSRPSSTQPASRPGPKAKKPAARRNPMYPLLLFGLGCLVTAAAAWSASTSPALASILSSVGAATPTHVQLWAQADIAKPTYTPSPTPTPTETPTPTPNPTRTPWPAESEPAAPPAPEQEYAAGNKYILVDISEQHLYAYEGDMLIYSFVASTGINNATRVGKFGVLDKIPNAYGSTWNIWMPDWLGIYWAGGLENGIHALPILPGGGHLWAGYLGWPVSYGCVVLGSDEAQLLYDWAEIGTPVEIRW